MRRLHFLHDVSDSDHVAKDVFYFHGLDEGLIYRNATLRYGRSPIPESAQRCIKQVHCNGMPK